MSVTDRVEEGDDEVVTTPILSSYFNGTEKPISERIVWIEEAEKMYYGERPDCEEYANKCDYCFEILEVAKKEGLSKIVIDEETGHFIRGFK